MGYFAIPSAGIGLPSSGVGIDLYVRTTGDDNNPGTAALPLLTVTEAVRRLDSLAKITGVNGVGATVHVGAGTFQWTMGLGPFFLSEALFFIGDGGGLVGDDGFTVLLASTAALAGSGLAVVKSSGLTVNQYRGKTIQILSGAAAGDRRTIRNNTATDIIPSGNFSAAIATNDTYRILEPNCFLEFESSATATPLTTDFPPIAKSCGGTVAQVDTNGTGTATVAPSIYFINFRFQNRTGDADPTARICIIDSAVTFFGVELNAVTSKTMIPVVDKTSILQAGMDFLASTLCLAVRPFEAGLATSRTSWSGWGVSGQGAGSILWNATARFMGYIVETHSLSIEDCEWRACGGSVLADAAMIIARWGHFTCLTSGAPTFLIRSEATAASTAALLVRGNGQAQLLNCTIEKQNQGFAILVRGDGGVVNAIPGQVGLGTGVTLTGETSGTAPTNAICVTYGGQLSYIATPTISGFTTGTQLCVRQNGPAGTVVQQCDFTDLATNGDCLPAQPIKQTWNALGALSGFADGVAGTFTVAGSFDGMREITRTGLWDTFRLRQLVDGTAGTTSVELFRRRGGVLTSLGIVSRLFGGGAFAEASLTPASAALRALSIGDVLVVQFTARQTNGETVTVELLGDVDGRWGRITRVA